MAQQPSSVIVRCGMTLAAVGFVTVLRWPLVAAFGELPVFTLYFPVMALLAITMGSGAAAFATLLSLVAAFTLIPPTGRLQLSSSADLLAAGIFVLSGAIMGLVGALFARYKVELAAAAEHRGADQAMRAIEEQHRLLVEQASDGIFVSDALGRHLEVNSAGCKMLGYSREEILRRSMADVIEPKDRDRTAEELARLARGEVLRSEWHFRRKDGSSFLGEVLGRQLPGGKLQAIVRDITEQRSAEESLKERETQLRLLGDNLPESAVYQYTRSGEGPGRFTYFSAGIERMNGVKLEDVLRDPGTLHRQILPEYFKRLMEEENRCIREMADFGMDVPMRRPDGEVRWMRIHSRPRRLADGTLVWDGVQTDITDRKRAEEKLRESEERFRSVLENMSEGLMLFDAEENLIYQNRASLRIHGFGEDEGRMSHEVLPATWNAWDETGRPITFEEWPVSRVFRKERFQDQVLRVVRVETGQEFYGSYNGSPICDAEGRIVLGFITIHDITQEVRAQRALASRERRLRVFFESDMVGTIYWNMDGEIVDANDKFLRMVGYSREELCAGQLDWARMTPSEYAERDQHAMAELRETGVDTAYEKEYIRKDGSRVPIIVGAAMLDEERHDGVAFVLDITERKRAEQDLQQAKEAAELASRAKDQFLAVLSHELRTPLMPVVMTASLLAKRQDLPVEVQGDLQTIMRNAQMEARLIDDLLDLTRISKGKMQFDFRTVDAHLVLRAAADISGQGDGAPIRLELQAAHHWVRADAARLQQVFWNVLNNARKFTPIDGTIIVRSTNVEAGRIQVAVIDNGAGMHAATLSKLFNAFEQGDSVEGRRLGGLGLGLAIARAIVDAHGGAIEAKSEGRGRGSTFLIELGTVSSPAGEAGVQFGEDSVSRAGERRSLRILLVEDHESTRHIMSKLIVKLGHKVQAVGSVEAAKAIVEREEFDLVVSDVGLPDGTGHDLMRWLREQHDLPGIALSGYGMEEDLRRSREAGFAEHLTKPLNIEQFEAALSRVIAGGRHG